MFEKANPSHPDKLADRIAGAIVDLAYAREKDPQIAVEVLDAGYNCNIVIETSANITHDEVTEIARRISPDSMYIHIQIRPQDTHLAGNQAEEIRCGDNGIFRGCPITEEQQELTNIMAAEYEKNPHDGKALIDGDSITMCLSHDDRTGMINGIRYNPLGYWTGGPSVDTGAVNRKLGSDLGDAVTGGGIHGKDLSKADVSVNVYLHTLAQETGHTWEAWCAIGATGVTVIDTETGTKIYIQYSDIVESTRRYINSIGGFEKLAEWGLIRPL